MKLTSSSSYAIASLLAATVFSMSAHADRGHSRLDYAAVVDVQPILESRQHRTPSEVCWTERVRKERQVPGKHDDSLVGTVVGGVLGGAIGNAVGV